MAKKKKKTQIKQTSDALAESLERFQPLLTADEYAALMAELSRPLLPSLRINPLKTQSKEVIQDWAERYRWETRPVPFCKDGYWVEAAEEPISKTVEHSMGHYYIQDAASMLPVELFDLDGLADPLILDMAASPGGKTTHLIGKTTDQGLVIANDSSRDRLTALRIVLQNWGTTHTAISNYPGEYFGAWFEETFDRILLDAPCSMQGLRASEAHPLRPITNKEVNALARRQERMLESALRALKTGGQVVYSTCTLTPEEDEAVLDAIVNRFPHAVQIDPLDRIIPNHPPGLRRYGDKIFSPLVENAARIWPQSYGTAGFFAARLTKTGDIPGKSKAPPARPLSQAGWFPAEQEETRQLQAFFKEIFGFDLEILLETHHLALWRHRDSYHLFPLRFLEQLGSFPVQGLGMALGEETSEGLMLSHEFCTRFGSQVESDVVYLDEAQLAAWMRGEDLAGQWQVKSRQSQVIVRDWLERTVGRGKLSPGRLRNDLPRRVLLA